MTPRWLLAALGVATLAFALAAVARRPPSATPIIAPARVLTPAGAPALTAPSRSSDPTAVSRAFLGSYVAFIYGRLSAAGLVDALPAVRRQAAAERAGSPVAVVADGGARRLGLRMVACGPAGERVTAVIGDGAAVYEVALMLRRTGADWMVAALRENG